MMRPQRERLAMKLTQAIHEDEHPGCGPLTDGMWDNCSPSDQKMMLKLADTAIAFWKEEAHG